MIKANELRIGNWVLAEGKPYQIKHISSGDEWEPIPITSEILEKIDWKGYIKFHINSYFSIDDVGHLYYHNDYTGINISYLHQLQNIYFALTGNELEINLNP